MPNPRVLVVGTGAIGGYYGGRLAQAGARVSVVSRSDYDVVRDNGIQVKSFLGDFKFRPEQVLRRASEYGCCADYIIVATKVLPEVDVYELIREAVGPETSIVLIQNGIEIEGPFVKAFPDNEVISALAFIAVSRTSPGVVHHQDYGQLQLGCFPSGVSEKAHLLEELFNASGVPCVLTPNVVTVRWRKLVWNASFNPISVLGGGVDTQQILGSSEATELVREVMAEVCRVAKAAGHELPADIARRNIDGTLAMKAYKTSMLLDFEAKRSMEVEAILGNAVRAAHRHGVSIPRLESLYVLLKLVDRQNRRS